MKLFHKTFIIILFCILSSSLSAQSISGRDFWVILPQYFFSQTTSSSYSVFDTVLFYVLSDTATDGTVDNEHFNFHVDFQVSPGNLTLLKIPADMVLFDSLVHYQQRSFRGVRIRSTHNIFLYIQNFSDIPDTFMISNLWYGEECEYYIRSPLLLTNYSSSKNPVIPLTSSMRYRFPDYDEDWWFERCGEHVLGNNLYNNFGSAQYLTALEDSTILYINGFSEIPWQEPFGDSILLNKEESVYIVASGSSPEVRKLRYSTNCKPVIGTIGANGVSIVGTILTPYMSVSASHAFQGKDFLCKKLENNRFDKGIYYLKFFECDNPPFTVWNDSVNRFMYNVLVTSTNTNYSLNQLVDQTIYFNSTHRLQFIRKNSLLTGNHRGVWGSLSTYESVPYTFLRSSFPIYFHNYNGPNYFYYKESAPGYSHYGVLIDTFGCAKWVRKDPYISVQPTDRMVKDWVYPTTRNNVKRKIHYEDVESLEIDTLYADVQIYVHENGLNTTYFNGQLLPAEVFDSFPMTNGDYYVTQMAFYNEDIPEIIRITNVNGFSAYVDEFGYNVLPAPGGHPEINDITKVYYDHHGASGCFYTDYPDNGIGLSPHNYDTVHRCLGDTLALLVEHNPDSVPVEWIVDGTSHLGDACSFPLAALDTLTVQCVLHYECPDTTTTFVVVVPPPLITVAHDTTVCAGATLSVEQPDVLSYLWSNGATTPSITVDSAGTFQVSVTNIGCRAESDSFHVSLYGQSAVDFGSDSVLCELATLLLDATQQHPAQYYWQDASTNTTYTVWQDGDYWVVITDHCLGASDTINIGYLNDFTVNLGPDTLLCEGKTLTLNAQVPYCDYLWQDGSTQPTYLVRGPGNYSVEVSNKCFSHWDAVNIDYEHCTQELYLPNAFTPNDDGKNPVFLPVFSYPDEIEEYRMEIYNRWGTLVFQTEEKTFGWDGSKAMDGVYAVVVHYKSRGEKAKTVKGSVTLIR